MLRKELVLARSILFLSLIAIAACTSSQQSVPPLQNDPEFHHGPRWWNDSPTPAPTGTSAPSASPTAVASASSSPKSGSPTSSASPTASPKSSASPAPKSSATAVPPISVTGNIYTLDGCVVYGPNDWFTTNLSVGGSSYAVNTVDPNSASIISNYTSQNPDVFDFNAGAPHLNASGTPFNNDGGTANMTAVSGCCDEGFNDSLNLDPSKNIPWIGGTFLSQGSCSTGDCHSEVIDSTACVEYATYIYGEQSWNGSTFTASAMAVHQLSVPYNGQDSGNGTTAAGFTLVGVYDNGDDEQNYIARSQVIPHILGIELSSHNGVGGYVSPASEEQTCSGNCSYRLPFGARLRLNPNRYTCPSASTNPQANLLCQQMEAYGVIIVDFGNSQVIQTEFEPSHDGTDPWNASDVSGLDNLKLEDFDVMTLGTIH
jgi:hypothetical protein